MLPAIISTIALQPVAPQAWLQAHGQAQIFGWIGAFILGIGFYSLTKMQSTKTFPAVAGWTAWILWTVGTAMRWLAGVLSWEWRVMLPLSGFLELAAFLFFYRAVRGHRSHRSLPLQMWTRLIGASSIGFMVTLIVNCEYHTATIYSHI